MKIEALHDFHNEQYARDWAERFDPSEDRMEMFRDIGNEISRPMLNIATQRVMTHFDRFAPVECDLVQDNFEKLVNEPVDAIVSTWALHDLFKGEYIRLVYQKCKPILNGKLINGDFIKPEGIDTAYEGGRIEIRQHLDYLQELGFSNVHCPKIYELNKRTPSTSNNYALIAANFS